MFEYFRLAVGDPSACLPLVSYALSSYSASVAEHLVDYGVELTGMNDLRFIENVYKVSCDLCISMIMYILNVSILHLTVVR